MVVLLNATFGDQVGQNGEGQPDNQKYPEVVSREIILNEFHVSSLWT
jgi:hypothetical protein